VRQIGRAADDWADVHQRWGLTVLLGVTARHRPGPKDGSTTAALYQVFGRGYQADLGTKTLSYQLPDDAVPSSTGTSVPEKVLKATTICWSVMIWLASGVYLFATTPEAHFISLSGLLFLIVGVFAAGFYGMLFYFSRRAFSPFLLKALSVRGPIVGTSVQALGFGLLAGEVVLVYLAASQCFVHILAGDFPSLIIHARTLPSFD
jgi:hypothetical protein